MKKVLKVIIILSAIIGLLCTTQTDSVSAEFCELNPGQPHIPNTCP